MSTKQQKEIAALRLRLSALRKAVNDVDEALEAMQQQNASPHPRLRQTRRPDRMASIDEQFHRYNNKPSHQAQR